MAARLVRKAIVENAGFQRAGCVALDNQRRRRLAQIGFGLFRRANQFDAGTSLAYVGFQNEGETETEPRTNFVERTQSRG